MSVQCDLHRITKIVLYDFLSYHGKHEFSFDSSVNLVKISGPVGSGKTNLLSAIIFTLYGSVSAKETTKIELLNDLTAASLPKKIPTAKELFWVEIEYTTKNNNIFRLKRTAYKTTTKIELFDSSGTNILESYKNVSSAQEFINAQVLSNLDFTLFSYSTSFFIDSDKTVLNLLFDKHTIFEVFDYFVNKQVYDDYTSNLSETYKNLRTKVSQLSGTYNTLFSKALALRERINNYNADQQQRVENEVVLLTESINNYRATVEQYETKTRELQGLLDNYRNMLSTIEREIGEYNSTIMQLSDKRNKYIDLINRGMCPLCKSKITSDTFDAEIAQIDSTLASIKQKFNELTSKRDDIFNKINSVRRELDSLEASKSKYVNKINDLTLKISTLRQSVKSELSVLRQELTELLNEGKEVSATLIATYKQYKALQKVHELLIANNRLRQYLYLSIIERLNATIHNYALTYGFDLYPQFITSYERKQWFIDVVVKSLSTNTVRKKTKLSTGEKRIVTLLIFVTLFNEVSAKYGRVPVLLFDEFISNMDNVTREKVVSLLEHLCETHGTQLFFVTHAPVSFNVDVQTIDITPAHKAI